jgi:diacylglycerol O-acyltransferase
MLGAVQQLSGQDAVFLYADTPDCPLQIASLVWLRLPESCRPMLPWFRDYYARTIHEFPAMRQRVVQDPLRIDHPYWVDDPGHTTVPGWREPLISDPPSSVKIGDARYR